MSRQSNQNNMRTLIIIPTYNEAKNIVATLTAVSTAAPAADILVVDDSSPDGTAQLVKNFSAAQKNPAQISLLLRPQKNGLGAAYIAALKKIKAQNIYEQIITLDADGSHDANLLPQFFAALQKNNLVIGSRYVPGGQISNWNFWRRQMSRIGNWYARLVTGLPIKDQTSGFVGFRSALLQKIDLEKLSAVGYFYQVEFKFRCIQAGANFLEIPIIFKDRAQGESKLSGAIIKEAFVRGLALLRARFPRFFN